MMATKKLIYAATFVTALATTSCSDQFLEDKKMYKSLEDKIFTNQTQTDQYLAGIYKNAFSGLTRPDVSIAGKYENFNNLTEEAGGLTTRTKPTEELVLASECDAYIGNRLKASIENVPYTRIRDCNCLLDRIDDAGGDVSETFRQHAKGQALVLRAIQYFDLVRMYGGVPIVTKVLDADAHNESSKLPRATVTKCIEQIVKDLNQAAEYLPDSWGADDYGRFTRAAALALKSRILLVYASPIFNRDWDNSSNERWQAALEAGLTAETELTKAGYGLYGSSAKDWAEMFLMDNTPCKEVLIVQLCSPEQKMALNNGWENSIRMVSQNGGGGLAVPRELYDNFPLADGSRAVDNEGNSINGYNSTEFFMNRDPRFYRTFAFSGSLWKVDNKADTVWLYRWFYPHPTEENVLNVKYTEDNNKNSPVIVRKMSNPAALSADLGHSGIDVFEYRYAELLLNIAECYAATGNVSKCIEYLGKIRSRVGISSKNDYGLGNLSDKYQAIEACLYERRVELAYEGKRFWDIWRWLLFDGGKSDNDIILSDKSTCEALGVKPLNSISRQGAEVYVKSGDNKVFTEDDPLWNARANVCLDPDAENFEEQQVLLRDFYRTNFSIVKLTNPMDNIGKPIYGPDGESVTGYEEANISWRSHYYIWGLPENLLNFNTWLEQTIGWMDDNNAVGTFNFQDSEPLTVK